MPLSRRQLLRAGLAGGAGLAAAGWAPTRALLGHGGQATTVQMARVRLDGRFAPFVAAFDSTEHVHDGMVDVMLWPGDRARLDATGASYDLVIEDWHRQFLDERRHEMRMAEALGGERNKRDGYEERVSYRVYDDYLAEMDALAELYPQTARRFSLSPQTWLGRTLEGLVIGGNVERAEIDGRPQAIMCGLHHAREWPSGEFTLNFAHDLLHGHAAGDETFKPLVDATCTYVIPVSNPDGFVRSREWLPVAASSAVWSTGADLALIVAEDGPGKRRNLRDNGSGNTAPFANDIGVDTNRNYPLMWGGVGASDQATNQTYFGPAPASEPEVQAMLTLLRRTQLIAGISNHTSGNLMLRPWGYTPIDTPDEELLTDLGARMADRIKYTNGSWNEALYPGSGIWDDWLYGVQGTLAYTMEHFTMEETGNYAPFHPVYAAYVQDKYDDVRASYVEMLTTAADPASHAVINGEAPAGTELRLSKSVEYDLSRPDPDTEEELITETIEASLTVGASGTFSWHANPSESRFNLQEYGGLGELYLLSSIHPDGTTRTVEFEIERGGSLEVTL